MSTNPILQVVGATSTAPDGTPLLDNVSFSVQPGWMVAVVGPTGAGKTSLAKALLGELRLSQGSVRVAGRNGSGRVAGVPQDDATHPQLSLRRTLEHAAALRVEASPAERRRRVDAVLAELGLTSRAGTRLADLSGGERKRANVAVELLGCPDLLVLDEPTSGLDPGVERTVFANLRELADSGRTIVAITHSVRVLDVCDRVLFLAPGGAVAFFGTPEEAAAYFEWDDPADAYGALAAEPASAWKARFAEHLAASTPEPVADDAHAGDARWAGAPTWAAQAAESGERWGRFHTSAPGAAAPEAGASASGHLGTLLRRALHVASSDRRTMALTLLAGPVLGLLLLAVLPGGTLRPGDDPGVAGDKAGTFAFFLAMTITWLGAAAAAREVVKERHILRRELGVGVPLTSYVSGKALFLSAVTAVQVIPLAGIALLRQGMPGAGPALGLALAEVMVVSLLVGAAAVATGLLVSSWASTSEKAMTALPVVLIAQLALAGPWAEDRGLGVDVMRQVVPAKWAATAVAATVTGDAGGWWLSVLAVSVLTAVQLGAALAMLRRSAPSRAAVEPAPATWMAANRPAAPVVAATRPSAIRFVPAAIAVVLTLAAGAGALGRGGDTVPADVALAPAPAPAAPTAAAPAAPPVAAPAATPAPAAAPQAPTPATARPAAAPAPAPAPRTAAAAAPRATTPATTRPAAPATTPPTTASPTTPTTRPPAAATANPLDPFGYTNYVLQQIFQPQRR